jgi:hypothetical protein
MEQDPTVSVKRIRSDQSSIAVLILSRTESRPDVVLHKICAGHRYQRKDVHGNTRRTYPLSPRQFAPTG